MIYKITNSARILRQPFDISTAEGRTKERYRRAIITTLASVFTKIVKILTIVISVPLAVNYLGTERYGLWLTISSLVSFLNFADFGMGNGLLNAISEANGKNDPEMAREYTSSAFFALLSLAFILAMIFACVYPWVSWVSFFNVSSTQAMQEAGPTMIVFMGCFLISIPLGIIQRVQWGYQEGFMSNIWESVGSLLGLIGILVAMYFEVGLPWLILAMAGAPVIALILNGFLLFGFRRVWLRPHVNHVTRFAIRKILGTGSLFFILQIAASILLLSDNIIIAQVLGASAVVAYAIPQKIFSMIDMILDMVITPLWPAYGEAMSRGDITWIKQTFFRSLVAVILFTSVCSLFLVRFGTHLISFWTRSTVNVELSLLIGFSVWTVIKAAGTATAMFLNGINVIRFQAIVAIIVATVALLAKIFLVSTIGLEGIIWGTIIAYVICADIPIMIYIPKLLLTLPKHTVSTNTKYLI